MKITDELLYQHASEARDIWLDTFPDDSTIPDHPFSQDFLADIEQRAAQEKKRTFKTLRRVAAVLLAFLVGSGAWLAVDVDARAAFVRWVREVTENSVVYRYTGEVPETPIDYYLCSWRPEGVEAVEVAASETAGHVVYQSEKDEFCVFSYSYMHSGTALSLFLPEDEMTHTEIEINGMPADFYEETGDAYSCFVIWFDEENEISFDISSNMSADDTLSMAKSVQEGLALDLMPRYSCTWLPGDYECRELIWGSHTRTESYWSEEKRICLEYKLLDGQDVSDLFTIRDDSERIPVTVWGQDAALYLNTHDDVHTLIWADRETNIAFCLEAEESQNTLLQVAEGIAETQKVNDGGVRHG